jgi:hypothetical protein
MSVEEMPSDEVASCWYEPPAYEPRSTPAAAGLEIPVPPPAADRRPERVLAKVIVEPEDVIVVEDVRPLNGVDDVARVIAGPVRSPPTGPMEVRAAESLLLNVDQSVAERAPLFATEAVGMFQVIVAPEPVMVKSVPVVEEAKMRVPAED